MLRFCSSFFFILLLLTHSKLPLRVQYLECTVDLDWFLDSIASAVNSGNFACKNMVEKSFISYVTKACLIAFWI